MGKVWEIVMAYNMHVGEDDGKTQALFDKLVDNYNLYQIDRDSSGYMKMKVKTNDGGMSELELERLCVKYFLTTNARKLELHINEYKVSFHNKRW